MKRERLKSSRFASRSAVGPSAHRMLQAKFTCHRVNTTCLAVGLPMTPEKKRVRAGRRGQTPVLPQGYTHAKVGIKRAKIPNHPPPHTPDKIIPINPRPSQPICGSPHPNPHHFAPPRPSPFQLPTPPSFAFRVSCFAFPPPTPNKPQIIR